MHGFYFIVLIGALSFYKDKQAHDGGLITQIKISGLRLDLHNVKRELHLLPTKIHK